MTWTLKCLGGFDKLIHSDVVVEVSFARTSPPGACSHGLVPSAQPVTESDLNRIELCLNNEWKELVLATQTFMLAVKPIAEVSLSTS